MLPHIGPNTGLKWLEAYQVADAPFFPFRSIDTTRVIQDIMETHLVILHGEQGSGKTSFIQAQLVPALKLVNQRVTIIRSICDPFDEIIADFHQLPVKKLTADHTSSDLIQLVTQTFHQPDREWVLILDPCENLLFQKGAQVARKLFAALNRIIHQQGEMGRINIHIVICLRSDFLSALDQYFPVFPLLKTAPKHLVANLLVQEIESFFEIFTRISNIHFSPELKNHLVDSFNRLHLRTVDIQLIVCFIYLELLKLHGSAVGSTYLELGYDQFLQLGNIPDIVRNFHNKEVEKTVNLVKNTATYQRQFSNLSSHSPSAFRADSMLRRCVRLVLLKFITKQKMSVPSSIRAVIYQVFKDESAISKKWIALTLVSLAHLGIIRRAPEDPFLLELISPSLAVPISEWVDTSIEAQFLTDTQYKIRQTIAESFAFRRLLIPQELDEIRNSSERTGFSTLELRLIFQSSLANAYQTSYWYARLKDEFIPTDDIIKTEKTKANFEDRVKVVKGLYKIGHEMLPDLISFLKDDFPQVRAFVIAALEKIDGSGDWRQNLNYEAYIPAGPFLMGTNWGNFADESPQHTLELDAFYICLSPVTYADYKNYMDDKEEPFDITPGMERHPITNLTWFQIQEYVRWALQRLPNEPEWEKAASWDQEALAKRIYPWGNQFDETICNMHAAKLNNTTPVGRYSRIKDPFSGNVKSGDSYYGCKDMAGNVWEWTNSIFMPYPYNKSDGREENDETGSRVIRGGSFECGATYVTCTVRLAFNANSMRPDLGFRAVLQVPDVDQ